MANVGLTRKGLEHEHRLLLKALEGLVAEYRDTMRSEFETLSNRTPELDSKAYKQALAVIALAKGN